MTSREAIASRITNRQYLGLEAKIDKSKTTLLSQTFKVAENKVPLFFFHFWPLGQDIANECFFTSIHIWLKSPESDVPVSL